MPLTDEQIANILFNEMRSFSGDNIDQARVAMAHVIMNGDNAETKYDVPREVTADHRFANVPAVEQKTYDDGMKAVKLARYHKSKNTDITGGAFNLYHASRKNQYTDYFHFIDDNGNVVVDNKIPFAYQIGPLKNSFPNETVPVKEGVYLNIYHNERIEQRIADTINKREKGE